MKIEVTKRHDSQYRIGLVIDGKSQKFTLKAAKQLRLALDDAIAWSTEMDDLGKQMRRCCQGGTKHEES